MKRFSLITAALALVVFTHFQVALRADNDNSSNGNGNKIYILDACDPNDPAWAPTGGCTLKGGNVTAAQFGAQLFTSLGAGVLIGHPAWRNDPAYVTAREGKSVTVENRGGRGHSFTEVANYGGGVVPPLNGSLAKAPECDAQIVLPPGDKIAIAGLAPGVHKFQCCIHPWMRATIKVD